jgi:hypothetical protein
MHLVSKVDGLDYVVVLDGVALSSWCLPDEVVSDEDIQASSESLLSTDGDGRFVLAWDDGVNEGRLVTVDTLELEQRYDGVPFLPPIVDASGEGMLQVVNLLAPDEVIRADVKGQEVARSRLPFPAKPPVALSTGWFTPRWPHPRSAGRAGRLAVCDAQGRALLVDLNDFSAPRVLASALLQVPPTWDVRLTPFEDALGVIAHDIAGGTATAWVVSGKKVLFKQKGLAALTMPAFASKDTVLTQTSEEALARVSLQSGAARSYRLPALGRETQLDPRGAGTPIAGADVTAFLPWHRESLITFDPETGEPAEVSRLLSAAGRELRQLILQRLRVANEAARVSGTRFELQGLDIRPKRKSYTVGLSSYGGDGSLWARTVMGALHGMAWELSSRTFGELRLGGTRHQPIPEKAHRTTDVGEMAAILARVDQYGLRFSSLAPIIDGLYERAYPLFTGDPAFPQPLTDAAGLLLLQAFFAWCTSEAPVKLAPGVERWRASPASAEALAVQVPHLRASHAGPEPRLLVPLARLAVAHLKAGAGALLVALFQDADPSLFSRARDGLREAVHWWAREYRGHVSALAPRVRNAELRQAMGLPALAG